MGGIAGILYPDHLQLQPLIEPMLNAMSHRGPAKRDIITRKNVQLGICGNSIAFNEKKNLCVLIDGHIYNHVALCHELKEHGIQTTPDDHTGLILHAYTVWKESFLQKLEGDFALAIFNKLDNSLFLARDRIGHKPLYWTQDGALFLFASELKGILASGLIPTTPALDAIAAYLTMGYIPQDLTPIQKINKLLPGHYLHLSEKKGISIHNYWSYSSFFTRPNRETPQMAVEHLSYLLKESVQIRLPAKGKVGCFVSGGLGSSSMAYMASKLPGPSSLQTLSVGYQGQNDEDIQAASLVSKILHLPQKIDWITPQDLLDNLVSIVWHLDEPLADPNIIATWKLAELASDSPVVISGMGSDELLAGHSRYTVQETKLTPMEHLLRFLHPIMRHLFVPIIHLFSQQKAYSILKESHMDPWHTHYLQHNTLFDDKKMKQAAPTLVGQFDPDVFLHKFHNICRIRCRISTLLYFDVKTRLADCYVMQYDRLMSAHNLDWRPPFLDRQVLEYLAGFSEPDNLMEKDTASFLKMMLKDVFPPEIIDRPKRTRQDFLKSWIIPSGLVGVFKHLENGILVETGLISKKWIHDQLESPQKLWNTFSHLWGLLILEIWFKLYINTPIGATPPSLSLIELLKRR